MENNEYPHYSRFNYGVITMNLPHICLEVLSENNGESDNDKMALLNEFMKKINHYSNNIMKDALISRYENVKKMKAKQAPILFVEGGIARLNPEDTIESLLKSTKASISFGYIGIDDCVRMLSNNKENISTPMGYKMGMNILEFLNSIISRLKEELDLPISLYGTPSEASIGTFFEKDKEQFGSVMPEWLLSRGYYTNSFHYSSELSIDPFDKIRVESKFSQNTGGGNISYVENGGKIYNWESIIELIQYAYHCGTEYFAVNTISDVCYECKYVGEMKYDLERGKYICPECGNEDGTKMKVQRRSCGLTK